MRSRINFRQSCLPPSHVELFDAGFFDSARPRGRTHSRIDPEGERDLKMRRMNVPQHLQCPAVRSRPAHDSAGKSSEDHAQAKHAHPQTPVRHEVETELASTNIEDVPAREVATCSVHGNERETFDVCLDADLEACFDEDDLSVPDYVVGETDPGNPDCSQAGGNDTTFNVFQNKEKTRATPSELCNVLRKRLNCILTWDKMLAYLSISGRAPFSALQYATLVSAVRTARARTLTDVNEDHAEDRTDYHLHTYKTIRAQMKRYLGGWCLPKSTLVYIGGPSLPTSRSPSYVSTINAGRKRVEHCVSLVLPSEWAKMDISTPSFYADAYEHPRRADSDFLTIENTPIVNSRAAFCGKTCVVWSYRNGVPCVSQPGDTLTYPTAAPPSSQTIPDDVRTHWPFHCSTAGTEQEKTWSTDAIVVCAWTVGSQPGSEQRQSLHMTPLERALYERMQTPSVELFEERRPHRILERSTALQSLMSHSVRCFAGDICVLLRPAHTQSSDHTCVFVGSAVQNALRKPSERLLWIKSEHVLRPNLCMQHTAAVHVVDIPTCSKQETHSPRGAYGFGSVTNKGFLENGERYVVYRFALYADGFNQFKAQHDSRSVTGCYILPLGLSVDNRNGSSATRPITLASSSTSEYKVIHSVLDDISRAARTGLKGSDPYGREVNILLDPVSFYGDYPAVSACCDALGHTANAFCTHCHVVKRRAPGSSKMLNNTVHHSRRLGVMRTDTRSEALRSSSLPSTVLRLLGMRSNTNADADQVPLIALGKRLRRAARPPLRDDGNYTHTSLFDSSMSTAIAPDHLVNGLVKNVLTVVFSTLNNNQRRKIEVQILDMAIRNGLPVTGAILRWGKNHAYQGIMNQTMSALMCILLCTSVIFYIEFPAPECIVYRLPNVLQRFVAKLYYWPSRDGGNPNDEHMWTEEGRMKYYGELANLAFSYLDACEQVHKSNPPLGKVLDKPNAHRALELTLHTVPAFGHALQCSELVLETTHRIFKEWMEKNTNASSHITAMERALIRDWNGRLYTFYNCFCNGSEFEKGQAESGLLRMIVGEQSRFVKRNDPFWKTFLHDFRTAVHNAFQEPVLSMMSESMVLHSPRERVSRWEMFEKEGSANLDYDQDEVVKKGLEKLQRDYGCEEGTDMHPFIICRTARFVRYHTGDRRKLSYPHGTITRGCAVSAIQEDVERTSERDRFKVLRFFLVYAIVEAESKDIWLVTRRLREANVPRGICSKYKRYSVGSSAVELLQLTNCVRRVACVHVCDTRCSYNEEKREMVHSLDATDGGVVCVLAREDGYPPHIS